jgi:hypothetical protein
MKAFGEIGSAGPLGCAEDYNMAAASRSPLKVVLTTPSINRICATPVRDPLGFGNEILLCIENDEVGRRPSALRA